MKHIRHAVLICEDGWEGTREFALGFSRKGVNVSVVIKGDPGREVREMISLRPGMRNFFFARGVYRLWLFPLLLWLFLTKRWNFCCVTKERTHRHLQGLRRWLGFELYRLDDSGKNSSLISLTGERIPISELLKRESG